MKQKRLAISLMASLLALTIALSCGYAGGGAGGGGTEQYEETTFENMSSIINVLSIEPIANTLKIVLQNVGTKDIPLTADATDPALRLLLRDSNQTLICSSVLVGSNAVCISGCNATLYPTEITTLYITLGGSCSLINYPSGTLFYLDLFLSGKGTASGQFRTSAVLVEKQCDDSDGGNNIYALGVCRDKYGSIKDRCTADARSVREHICGSNNRCEEVSVACETGQVCSKGKCVSTELETLKNKCINTCNDAKSIAQTSGTDYWKSTTYCSEQYAFDKDGSGQVTTTNPDEYFSCWQDPININCDAGQGCNQGTCGGTPPTPSYKDLTITNVEFSPTSPVDGNTITANVMIKNLGTEAITEDFRISVSPSECNVCTTTSTQTCFGCAKVSVLQNQDIIAGNTITIPITLGAKVAGTYNLEFTVDSEKDVDELNEDNNQYEATLIVSPKPQPITEVLEETITLNQGWNLVSISGELVTFTEIEGKLKAYIYVDNKFVPIKKAARILGADFSNYFVQNAFFIYAKDGGKLSATVLPDNSNQVELSSGWNLAPIRTFLKDKALTDVAGTCALSGAYYWDIPSQAWKFVENNQQIDDYVDANSGFITYVPNDCTLFETVWVPIPDNTTEDNQGSDAEQTPQLTATELQSLLQKSRLYDKLDEDTVIALIFRNEFGEDVLSFTIEGSKKVKEGVDYKKQLTLILPQESISSLKSSEDLCGTLQEQIDEGKLTKNNVKLEQGVSIWKFMNVRSCVNIDNLL